MLYLDAFTSVLAIIALAAGLWLGWSWLDPLMGIVGAGVILWWSKGLVGDSARVLLDREMDAPLVLEIRKAIEVDGDAEIADLHVWRVGRACHAAVLVWDYRSWDVLSARHIKLICDADAVIALPIALSTRSAVHLFAGEFAAAASLVAEVESVTEATGSSIAPYGADLGRLAGPGGGGLRADRGGQERRRAPR